MPQYNGLQWDGLAEVINKASTARVTGSDVTRTAQTLADVTGLSLPLSANSTYQFEAMLSVACTDTNGNEYGVNFSQSGATVEAQITGTLTAAVSQSKRISALNTATAAFATVNGDGAISISGVITTGTNVGNLTVQHLKVTSGTSTVYVGSVLTARKVA